MGLTLPGQLINGRIQQVEKESYIFIMVIGIFSEYDLVKMFTCKDKLGEAVANALEKIIIHNREKTEMLWPEKGKEFSNRVSKQFSKSFQNCTESKKILLLLRGRIQQ